MTMLFLAGLALVLGLATDFLWCKATQSATQYKPLPAAIFSCLLSAVGLLSYWDIFQVKSIINSILYCIGCAIGAYFTSRKPISDRKFKI